MSNARSTSTAKLIRFENELLDLIGDVENFSGWVKEACREKIQKTVESNQIENGEISNGE